MAAKNLPKLSPREMETIRVFDAQAKKTLQVPDGASCSLLEKAMAEKLAVAINIIKKYTIHEKE